jgi:hypothetical protein
MAALITGCALPPVGSAAGAAAPQSNESKIHPLGTSFDVTVKNDTKFDVTQFTATSYCMNKTPPDLDIPAGKTVVNSVETDAYFFSGCLFAPSSMTVLWRSKGSYRFTFGLSWSGYRTITKTVQDITTEERENKENTCHKEDWSPSSYGVTIRFYACTR